MKDKLYAVICEMLDVLIEDFCSGDIDLPVFASKVERVLGPHSLNDLNPEHGFEWNVLPNDTGFNLYYASATHRATMQIRLIDSDRYVHATISHDDDDESLDAAIEEDEANEDVARAGALVMGHGCGDPNCPNCGEDKDSAMSRIKEALEKSGMKIVGGDQGLIPPGLLLSFGPLKRDEN